jgi:hypothetical protein
LSDTVRGVGFDRKIRLAWLEAVAGWTASGMPEAEIRAKLDLLLEGEVTGKEARKKTKTVLLRTWLLPSERLYELRNQGLSLLIRTNDSERLALHWGMVCSNHPVVWETASVVGRLLRLQGEASVSQVRARVEDIYGERSTVVRASQRILRSFADWKVLEEMPERGVYRAGDIQRLEDPGIIAWLIEASLLSSGQETRALPTLLNSPSLFPFDISLSGREFSNSNSRLALYSQGRNEALVSLQSDGEYQ